MPRQARNRTDTGIYHVILRGINRQQLFLDPEDDEIFLEVLRECKALSGFKIYAYCLMGNHVHLLFRTEIEGISSVMKRVGVRFVQRINRKYGRTGHLFQDRYKSEAVSDDGYFLNLIRYIHQNPVKAGVADNAADYSYSSYNTYAADQDDRLTDTGFLYGIIDKSQFIDLMRVPVSGTFMDLAPKSRQISDQKAVSLIKKTAPIQEAHEMQQLAPDTMDKAILLLLAKGVSVRQLSRLTGIPRGHIDSVSRKNIGDVSPCYMLLTGQSSASIIKLLDII
jgi:putative transposase